MTKAKPKFLRPPEFPAIVPASTAASKRAPGTPKRVQTGPELHRKGPKSAPNPSIPPETRVVVPCTLAYKAWVVDLCDHLGGITQAVAIDQGLRRLAEISGFSQPPRRRAKAPVPPLGPTRPEEAEGDD